MTLTCRRSSERMTWMRKKKQKGTKSKRFCLLDDTILIDVVVPEQDPGELAHRFIKAIHSIKFVAARWRPSPTARIATPRPRLGSVAPTVSFPGLGEKNGKNLPLRLARKAGMFFLLPVNPSTDTPIPPPLVLTTGAYLCGRCDIAIHSANKVCSRCVPSTSSRRRRDSCNTRG